MDAECPYASILDTSVLSALGDSRAPDRQSMTREFFARIRDFDACTSELARIEIERTRDPSRRTEMLSLLAEITVHATTPEAEALAQRYIDAGIIPAGVPEDALHVASAVLLRQEVLVSWNFKHIVNLRRRAAVQAMNASLAFRRSLSFLHRSCEPMTAPKRPSWFVPTPAAPEHFDYPAAAKQAGIRADQLAEIVLAFEIDYPSDLMLRELHVLRACNSVLAGRTSLDKMLADLRRGHSEAA